MKNIITLISVIIMSFGHAQQQTYNLSFEDGTDGSNPAYWNVFESDTPAVEIVTNPDPDGVNPDANTKVMKLNVLVGNACYAGSETQHATIGTWVLEAGVTSNESISMMVNKSTIGRIGIKFVNATNGTIFELTSQTNMATDVWELMTWDISPYIASAENNNIDQVIIYSDFTCGDPDRTADSTTYIDNVTWGALKTGDPVLPTCSDGVQNGDEDGVDCGGSSCTDCENFPFDFEVPTPFIGADGAIFNIISDNGNMVGELQNVNAQDYSNAQIITGTLNFDDGGKGFSMRVKGNRALPILFKVEQSGTPAVNFEDTQNYTTPGAWQTLIFDFTAETSNGVLNKPVIFFDILGAPSADPNDDIFLFDDIIFDDFSVLGVSDFAINDIKVYPNPTNDKWFIQSIQEITEIKLYDLAGKLILTQKPNSRNADIDTFQLENGLYFAHILSFDRNLTLKLIKK